MRVASVPRSAEIQPFFYDLSHPIQIHIYTHIYKHKHNITTINEYTTYRKSVCARSLCVCFVFCLLLYFFFLVISISRGIASEAIEELV